MTMRESNKNPFLRPEGFREFFIVEALVRVKSKRMSEDEAISEAIKQRAEMPEDIDMTSVEDSYKACQILYDENQWFRDETSKMVLQMQREK